MLRGGVLTSAPNRAVTGVPFFRRGSLLDSLDEIMSAAFAQAPVQRVSADALPVLEAGKSERMYDPVEGIFSLFAEDMVAKGWSIFPQERDASRRPAMVDGRALKWGEYQKRLPTEEEVASWKAQCPSHNIAVITGKTSNFAFAFDVDVSDPKLSWEIEKVAAATLGVTPFRRVGRQPRIVLIYRHDPDFKLRKRTLKLTAEDGVTAGNDAIDILAGGTPFTAYGKHHSVGKYFNWLDYEPSARGPEDAPLVTAEQIDAFIEGVAAIRPLFQNKSTLTSDVGWEISESTGLIAPKMSNLGGGSDWLEDDSGKVTDGREKFLFTLVRNAVRANLDHAHDETGVGAGKLLDLIVREFRTKTAWSDKWDDNRLHSEAREKLSREISFVKEHNITRSIRAPTISAAGKLVAPSVSERKDPPARAKVEGLDVLSHIIDGGKVRVAKSRRQVSFEYSKNSDDKEAEIRKLTPQRAVIASEVQKDIHAALSCFFDEVYDSLPNGKKRIHVLKAPTGAGKTTHTIRYIASDPRTKQWDDDKEKGGDPPGPIVFLLPTYNNIEELRTRASGLNLDPSLDDAALEAQAREKGVLKEDDVDPRIADLRRDAMAAGLRTMVYKGKIAAGCQMQDKMQMLLDAGIGSSGLCKAIVQTRDGEKDEKLCPHYHGCPAILQRKEIARSHVVFLPHAFFTLNIPDELKNVRCVIADERIFHLFVHTTSFSRTTLLLARKPPRLTKKEREGGVTPELLLIDRDEAAEIAAAAFQRGTCPAQALADLRREGTEGRFVTGLDLVRSAKRVCGSALTTGNEITPETSVGDIQALCETPTGTEVREEWRFWQIVEERVEALIHDKAYQSLADMAGRPWPRTAKGTREMRIQFLIEKTDDGALQEKVRISWRSKPNWAESSLLLLDASAAPPIISKIFDKRVVKVHEVEAALNVRTVAVIDRTYSNASIVSRRAAEMPEKAYAAKLKAKLRTAISQVSSLYGWGRVVCGASVMVRRAINGAWFGPANVDWCHFGAMRGLDFAKHHTAALSIGRMEVPIQVIDGLVGALTFDDEDPELPYDVRGDNVGPDGRGLMLGSENQDIRMRSGVNVMVLVPMFPGRWARMVQKQYREEELSQFLGRLRPVYREGEAPVWFAISKVVPENVIVDDIITLDDLAMNGYDGRLTSSRLWDAVRMADGVMHPKLLHHATDGRFYKDESKVLREMEYFGFGKDGACGLDKRFTWGYTPVRIVEPDRKTVSWCFVRSDIRDIAAHVQAVFWKFLNWNFLEGDIQVGVPVRPMIVGGHRIPDWVDIELGDRAAREAAERNEIQKAAEDSLRTMPQSSFVESNGQPKSRLPLEIEIVGKVEDVRGGRNLVDLDDLAAMRSTDAIWARLAPDTSLPVIADPGADFSHLGDGAHDIDAEAIPDMPPMPAELAPLDAFS